MEKRNIITIESLEEPNTIPVLGIETINFWTMFGPIIAGPIVGALFGTALIGFIIGFIGSFVGIAAVYATPPHLNIKQAYQVWKTFAKKNTDVYAAASEVSDESLLASFKLDESTRDFLEIERYYPEIGVVKNTDGDYLGGIKLNPPNMDFSEGGEIRTAELVGGFHNEQMSFDTQLYITTEPFPLDEYIDNLKSRRESQEVQEKPIMEALLDEQIELRPKQLEQKGTQMTEFYLIVKVPADTISTSTTRERTPIERLSDIPVLGIFAEIFINISSNKSDLEEHGESLRELQDRLQTVQRGLVGSLEGWDGHQITLAEWMFYIQRMGKGREVPGKPNIRQQPVNTTPSTGTGVSDHESWDSEVTNDPQQDSATGDSDDDTGKRIVADESDENRESDEEPDRDSEESNKSEGDEAKAVVGGDSE